MFACSAAMSTVRTWRWASARTCHICQVDRVLLHGGQHPIGSLRDPVGVGHARGFCGGGKCRRDHRGDGAAATEDR